MPTLNYKDAHNIKLWYYTTQYKNSLLKVVELTGIEPVLHDVNE